MSADASIRLTLEQDRDYAFRIHFDETSLEPLLADEAAPLGSDRGPTPSRNADGRLRIPKAFVTLHLPEGNEDYQHLERILDQFENFCTVTQSVRHGIEVDVTVKDAHGRTLMGDKSFEAGS